MTTTRVKKLLRLVVGFTLVFSMIAGLVAMKTVAAARSELLELGDGLAAIAGDFQAPTKVRINGRGLRMHVGTNGKSVAENLDRFERWCADAQPSLEAFGSEDFMDAMLGPEVVRPMLRQEVEDRGYVACIRQGGPTSRGLVERLRAFASSTDLDDLGHLYYLRAEKASESTRVLAIGLDQSFPLADLFPASGDAPGVDPLDLRPAGSRRIASAWVDERPNQFGVYELAGKLSEVAEVYRAQLEASGWTVRQGSRFGWALQRSKRIAFVSLGQEAELVVVSLAVR